MKNRAARLASTRGGGPLDKAIGDGKAMLLLESAGHVFAEKGFDRATGKEICAQAGMNAAAINYYFGGIEALYAEVLVEARERLVGTEALKAALKSVAAPKQRLRMVMETIVATLTGPASSSWMMRVLSREIIAPSPVAEVALRRNLSERLAVIRSIAAGIAGLPEGHPSVALGAVSVVAPCILLLIADRRAFQTAIPQLPTEPAEARAVVDHLVNFAVAGLEEIGRVARGNRTQSTSTGDTTSSDPQVS